MDEPRPIETWLTDMDGVLVHEEVAIPGAAELIEAAVEAADGSDDLTVVTREELPRTRRFWERQGFREIRRDPPNVELRRPLRTHVAQVPDAEAMRGLGRSLAGAGADLAAVAALAADRDLGDGAGETVAPHGATEDLTRAEVIELVRRWAVTVKELAV